MGYIKEPKGVDFIINSNPLTDKDRNDISNLIADYKKKSKQLKEKSQSKLVEKKLRHRVDVFHFMNKFYKIHHHLVR